MKAFIINPNTISISEVELDETEDGNPTLDSINSAIGCSWIDVARLDNPSRDVIYVDDEGLLLDENSFFRHEEYPEILAGIGVVLGTDDQGNSIEPSTTLDELREKIAWVLR